MTAAEILQTQAQATMLLRMLTRRFGPLKSEIEERVTQASAEQLALWADRILTEPTLNDVLGE